MHRHELLGFDRWNELEKQFDHCQRLTVRSREAELAGIERQDPGLAETLRAMIAADAEHDNRTDRDRADLFGSTLALLQSAPVQMGDRLGPYALERELGRGGMGVVFLAGRSDGRVQKQVAIKILARHAIDSDTRRRFMQEREILATLDHPHIARFLDAGETDGAAPYYVMEHIDGIPLASHCDLLSLSISKRLQLFLDVADAIRYAHGKLILHRDIKSSNVLVTGDGVAKLIDFGIAKPMSANMEATGTRLRFFSPLNVAPEQLRGDRPTVACDVYQLGTLLYELICGQPIFDVERLTPAALEEHIFDRPPEPPSAIAGRRHDEQARRYGFATSSKHAIALRGDLDNIVLQTLRKSPRDRYASVERLADDVRRYLTKRPIAARRGHAWYRARKLVSRHRVAVVVSVSIAVMIAAFLFALLLQAKSLEHQRDLAQRDRDRADTVAGLLMDVFNSADPGVSLVHDMPISEVLAGAEQRLRSGVVAGRSGVRIQLLIALADVRLRRGEYPQVRMLLDEAETALTLNKEQEHDPLRLALLETRARVEGASGYTRRAYELATQALAWHDRLDTRPGQRWLARLTQVRSFAEFGAPSIARRGYEALYAEMLGDPNVDVQRLAQMEVQLAQMLAGQFEFLPATELLAQAVARLERSLPPTHPQLIWIHGAQASLRNEIEPGSDVALAELESLYQAQTAQYGPQSTGAAILQSWISRIHGDQGGIDVAIAEAEHAYGIWKGVHADPHSDLIEASFVLGQYRLARADRTSIDAFEHALRMGQTLWGDDAYRVVNLRAWLAVARARFKVAPLSLADASVRAAIRADPVPTFDNVGLQIELALAEASLGRRPAALSRVDRLRPLLQTHVRRLQPLLRRIESAQLVAGPGLPGSVVAESAVVGDRRH